MSDKNKGMIFSDGTAIGTTVAGLGLIAAVCPPLLLVAAPVAAGAWASRKRKQAEYDKKHKERNNSTMDNFLPDLPSYRSPSLIMPTINIEPESILAKTEPESAFHILMEQERTKQMQASLSASASRFNACVSSLSGAASIIAQANPNRGVEFYHHRRRRWLFGGDEEVFGVRPGSG